jgi:hypothetical protein
MTVPAGIGSRRGRYAAIVGIALIVFVATAGPPAPSAAPPGTFSFAALGDAPYYGHEELQYRVVLKDLGQHELASVIHVGDLFWRPCSDGMYERSRQWLDALPHPVIYTPGDNEWFDCWEPRVGGYAPLERLARLRQIFFDHPGRSLGRESIALTSQTVLPENARWRHDAIVFATLHLIGSANGTRPFPGRTAADDAEGRQRTGASMTWLRETFAEATATRATAMVLAFHANPFHTAAADGVRREYEPFVKTLVEEAGRFGRPVLFVHGDTHEFIVDRPLPGVPNATRMQVPGSPAVGWVRVTVEPGPTVAFSFERRVVPRWKYW